MNFLSSKRYTVTAGGEAANFTYDANGDRVTRVDDPGTSIAATANYTWSSIGQLLSVQQGNNTVTFAYDGAGRRVELSANIGGSVTNEYYIYDGDQIIEKRVNGPDMGNITEKFYDYGYQTVSGNTVTGNYYYTFDHLGGVREVVGASGGNPVLEGRYVYDAWGETTYMDYSGGTVTQPDFGYAGYFQSKYVPGLYFTENRVYEPDTRQWLSRDPAGEDGGLNLYAYTWNNPVNLTDPSGLGAGNAGHPAPIKPIASCSQLAAEIKSVKDALQLLGNVAGTGVDPFSTGQAAVRGSAQMGGDNALLTSFENDWGFSALGLYYHVGSQVIGGVKGKNFWQNWASAEIVRHLDYLHYLQAMYARQGCDCKK